MSVFVDSPFEWPVEATAPAARRWGTRWCHLWALPEHVEALHALAAAIGLRREWFQDKKRFPHYDLVPSKRQAAIRAGAVPVEYSDWIRARLRTEQAQRTS